MKKLMAVLLAGCLTFQTMVGLGMPVQAEAFSSGTEVSVPDEPMPEGTAGEFEELQTPEIPAEDFSDSEEDLFGSGEEEIFGSGEVELFNSGEEEETQEQSVTDSGAVSGEMGGLEVEVISALPFKHASLVNVEISSASTVKENQISLGEGDGARGTASFAELPPGEYAVTVTAEKFARYTQTVAVEAGKVSAIQIYSAEVGHGGGDIHPGVMLFGDVTGDYQVMREDAESLTSALYGNLTDAAYDLNADGSVDLVDLNYVTRNLDRNQIMSSVEKMAYVYGAQTAEGEHTDVIGGSVENLLTNSGPVTLAPLNGTITEETPLSVDFRFGNSENPEEESAPPVEMAGITIYAPVALTSEEDGGGVLTSNIESGVIEVVTAGPEGEDVVQTIPIGTAIAAARAASVSVGADGSLTVDFGGQIAVKKVSIKIFGTTKKEDNFVNIARVEFVNDMASRIPAPELGIPVLNAPVIGSNQLTLSWSAQLNVTGYELYAEGLVKDSDTPVSQIIPVNTTSYELLTIQDKSLVNGNTYTVKVRSVNGDWKSPWSESITASPEPGSVPPKPDGVKAEGGYRSVKVSWKKMSDTDSYMVYYKKASEEAYQPVQGEEQKITGSSYTINELEDSTEYMIYVVGYNKIGTGPQSELVTAVTKSGQTPMLPNYEVINTSKGEGAVSEHIQAAAYGGSGGASMISSPLDAAGGKTAWGLVDNDYSSYWYKNDWDDGVAYPTLDKGVTVTLDGFYEMNYLTFAATDEIGVANGAALQYWDENGNPQNMEVRLREKRDPNNLRYYLVKFNNTVKTNKIRLCLKKSSTRDLRIAEMRFHYNDTLEDQIMALYLDEMHTTLREDVTEETINELQALLDTPDETSGELHPAYAELKLELDTARQILQDNLDRTVEISNQITDKKDGHLGFSGLNAWQPLGKVAYAGEKLFVYVGHNSKKTGMSAELQLVITQHHAESSSYVRTVALKVGKNTITVPKLQDIAAEKGGQLYIAYTGNNSSDQYGVRVSGGSNIPVLNLYGKEGEERTAAITEYVQTLEQHMTSLQQQHTEKHTGINHVNYDYDSKNCILNATDILMKEMMYSVPAEQIWEGIRGAADKAAHLDNALKAMESTMHLFYQHKGLSDQAGTARGNNALPSRHLNIRYMRMFAGAFMYASGNHIGVEWDQTRLLGAAAGMGSFGWGYGHEIGHNINQGAYAIAEITNNYFAQLLTVVQNGGVRFKYEDVYKKVTSGTTGRASGVFTQLAMYWQLHLAFDNSADERITYDNYEDQFQNLFFARVDTYARNPGKAPNGGVKLNGGADQNLMRLSCAAAEKNLLSFFERWGLVPDETTKAYAEKFGAPETKALYYVNDEARNYRVSHSEETGILNRDVVTARASANSNQVTVEISTSADQELILGYEILRSMTTNGHTEQKVVGFVPISGETTTFVDTISTINNRVMSYEVKAVDKFLNYSNPAAAGEAKIQTEGHLNKTQWTVETSMTSPDDVEIEYDENNPDGGVDMTAPERLHTIDRVADNDPTTVYNGQADGTAQITIDMHQVNPVTALQYQGTKPAKATVEISTNGSTWQTVKTDYDQWEQAEKDGVYTIWFDAVEEEAKDSWIGTYDARYVRLSVPVSGSLSVNEIYLCGPTGDNVEFLDVQNSIGILKEDFQYDSSDPKYTIPKGSVIFTGTYKGNPAYNVVMLYDEAGNVVGIREDEQGNVSVEAEQIILAKVPEQGNLGETSDGTWIYYITPDNNGEIKLPSKVRAELYRVDNAQTLEGERVVSDSSFVDVPENLPDITLTGNQTTINE